MEPINGSIKKIILKTHKQTIMKTGKEILSKYERVATFSDNTQIDRVITISQDDVESLERDINYAILNICQTDSEGDELFLGDKIEVYQLDEEFNEKRLIAKNAVIEYDKGFAQYVIKKDAMRLPFIEIKNNYFYIYKRGEMLDD